MAQPIAPDPHSWPLPFILVAVGLAMDSEADTFVASVYAHAAELLKCGVSPGDVRLKLQADLDLPKEIADVVVSKLKTTRAAARKEAGREMMLEGGLACAAGCASARSAFR